MREIGIEHLRKDLSGALDDMPFVITRRGMKVAIVEPYSLGGIEAVMFDIYCDTVKQLRGITPERKEDESR